MSWKDDLTNLVEVVNRLEKRVKVLQAQIAVYGKQIDALRQVVGSVEKNGGQSADRMADRLIEMAMVNTGESRDAAIHRRSLGETVPPEQGDLWQESPEDEWPPKGCDAVRMP